MVQRFHVFNRIVDSGLRDLSGCECGASRGSPASRLSARFSQPRFACRLQSRNRIDLRQHGRRNASESVFGRSYGLSQYCKFWRRSCQFAFRNPRLGLGRGFDTRGRGDAERFRRTSLMYLAIPAPPAPPPPSDWCKTLNLGCPPPPAAPNPDALASLYPALQTELQTPGDITGSTNSSSVVGLGCAPGGACHCGGKCKQHGMGIFNSGTDISGWGWQEWGVVGIGAFAVWSMFSTTSRGVSTVKRSYRRRASRAAKRARLQKEMAGL